jgi:hypothetical protein
MTNGMKADLTARLPAYAGSNLAKLDYFLNGQKIYSGVSGSWGIGGSKFTYNETSITGKLFATPKAAAIYETTGLAPDIRGIKFMRGSSNLFLNGMEEPSESWMELSTGVTSIVTGFQPKIYDTPYKIAFLSL